MLGEQWVVQWGLYDVVSHVQRVPMRLHSVSYVSCSCTRTMQLLPLMMSHTTASHRRLEATQRQLNEPPRQHSTHCNSQHVYWLVTAPYKSSFYYYYEQRWITIILTQAICKQPWASCEATVCSWANSASYPQRGGKWVVAQGLRGEGLVCWLGWWYVCVLHRGSNCSPSRAMDGRIMRHGIISSCQSAATSEIVKRCCSSLFM